MTQEEPEVLIGEIVEDDNFSKENFRKTGSYQRTAETDTADISEKLDEAATTIASLKSMIGKAVLR